IEFQRNLPSFGTIIIETGRSTRRFGTILRHRWSQHQAAVGAPFVRFKPAVGIQACSRFPWALMQRSATQRSGFLLRLSQAALTKKGRLSRSRMTDKANQYLEQGRCPCSRERDRARVSQSATRLPVPADSCESALSMKRVLSGRILEPGRIPYEHQKLRK